MTFSIVAWDPAASPSPEWGVAVASKFLAVGAVVAWARAGAGAVATQALANIAYGPDGLEQLGRGDPAAAVLERLTTADDQRDHRQVGIVDARGRSATFTGSGCFDWAGGRTGEGYSCQGNILAGPGVVDAMVDSFERSTGPLAARLIEAVAAGDAAGGDRRGRQSAAVLVVRNEGGYGGGTDKAVDLRVDDHPEPVGELGRLYEIHSLLFPRPDELEFLEIDAALAADIASLLGDHGYDVGAATTYDDELKAALFKYVGTENLEERWSDDARIERRVLEHLRHSRSF